MKISMDKKYTIKGKPYTVLTVTKPGDYPVVGHTEHGEIYLHQADGTGFYASKLVEVTPYDDFKIDEPVMVRDHDTEEWIKRYFAGVNRYGNPLTFDLGNTRWSNDGDGELHWYQCRRPTAEELAS